MIAMVLRDIKLFLPLRNHVPNLEYKAKSNMAAILNEAYYLEW